MKESGITQLNEAGKEGEEVALSAPSLLLETYCPISYRVTICMMSYYKDCQSAKVTRGPHTNVLVSLTSQKFFETEL